MLTGTGSGTGSALDAVFAPRTVALVGASERPGSAGKLLWDNLADFPGVVVPVCRAARVGGVRAYADLRDVPEPVDLAVVATPAASVPEVVRAAGVRGVRAVVVLSAGFAEVGAGGAALQDEVLAAARDGGVRVVGPNCFGVQNADLPLNASIAAGTPAGGGGISLVTQSGSYGMAVHALARDEAMRFAKVYAAGNKADLSDAEVLAYLREDPATTVICLLLEAVTGGREFYAEAARAAAVKPVLAVLTGRSGAGARAAASHTAALASDDAVRDAALRQAGVLRLRTGLDLLDAARAVAARPRPRGPRVAVVTNSGGTGVELTDLLAGEGLTVPELSDALQAALREVLPAYGGTRNPVDVTPQWTRFPELYGRSVDLLARSGEVDVVVPVLLQRSAAAEVAGAVRETVAGLRDDGVPVPVHVCWVAPDAAREHALALQRDGICCFAWPERTARAVAAAVRTATSPPAPGVPSLPSPASEESVAMATDSSDAREWLGPEEAARLLAGAGVPVADAVVCGTAGEAGDAADRLGYPAVAKVVHRDLVHKSDAGGVRVGLGDRDEVEAAVRDLLVLRDGARVLVQHQHDGVEVIVGGRRDPGAGPVVLAGLGGVYAEALRDTALALAPVTPAYARDLLTSLRGAALLTGVRGRPPVDLDALAAVVVAVGDLLVADPRLAELDLNPVLARPDGVVAVDWRVAVGRRRGRGDDA